MKSYNYYKDLLRGFLLDLLFALVGYLSSHKLTHAEEDTAELTDNRKGLRISFTFNGQVQEIVLPYNPYRLTHRQVVVVSAKTGEKLIDAPSKIPGLDDFLFSKEALEHIHDQKIETVDFESNEFDD